MPDLPDSSIDTSIGASEAITSPLRPQASQQKPQLPAGISAQLDDLVVHPPISAGEGMQDLLSTLAGVPQSEATDPYPDREDGESSSEVEHPYDMRHQEDEYLRANKFDESTNSGYRELDQRYASNETGASHVLGQIEEYAVSHKIPPIPEDGLQGFDEIGRERPGDTAESVALRQREYLKDLALDQIKRAFNVDTITPEEGKALTSEQQKVISVRAMTDRYIDLAYQALQEGDLQNFRPEDLAKMVRENVLKLAYQDYVAAENTLGDHGVRHLVDHNITVTEKVAAELQKRGQRVTAADRLMMHQIMIDHDLGYAMDPVRKKINGETEDGKSQMWADRGHNVLAAKLIRERAEMPGDTLSRIFTADQITTIHEGILTHDASRVEFRIGDTSEAARRENIMDMIHLADNTHAFETKLPEILYSFPQTLTTMRLMQTAAEVGDIASLEALKANLIDEIQNEASFSDAEKKALARAVGGLTGDSYKFTVGRICGNNPEFTLDDTGKVTIAVQESAIHREAVGLYGQGELDQLMKFMSDLSGKPKAEIRQIVQSNAGEFDTGKLLIKVVSPHESAETDYQKRVREIIQDEDMQQFVFGEGIHGGDAFDADAQAAIEGKAKRGEVLSDEENSSLRDIKTRRRERLQGYMRAKGIVPKEDEGSKIEV